MSNNDNIALIDMDGTICDYVGEMHRRLESLRAPGEPFIDPFLARDDPNHDYLWKRMDHIKASEGFWANLPRLELGFDVMGVAKSLGYQTEILTQSPRRNPAALAGKLRWILENLDEDTDFAMVRNKSRHYGRVLVDDYPGYFVPWLEVRQRGLVIMPSNIYNKDFEHPRVIRYNGENLDEVKTGLESVMVND